jgi:peroxiredoxin Q/BCP
MNVQIGAPAPQFSLPDQTGVNQNLRDYRGKWVVVYFYPKDDTPGCTLEACSFRDNYNEYQKQGIVILGISQDSKSSHASFQHKYSVPFPLLSDEAHQVINAYGAWQPKKFMGKEFLGTKRMTFLINPAGNLVKIYKNVNPKNHAAEILTDIADLLRKPR